MNIHELEPKIFGIGMSKTGTTSLGRCFNILGLLPHKSADRRLKKHFRKTGDASRLIKIAEQYRSFEDTPWFLAFDHLDAAFPGSKFILTTRNNSLVHAKSSWAHSVRAGIRTGEPTDTYITDKIKTYEDHNKRVIDHFKGRPDDLLVICWENGDDWRELCRFLSLPIPELPIPHANKGEYKRTQGVGRQPLQSSAFLLFKRMKYRVELIAQEMLRRVKSRKNNQD